MGDRASNWVFGYPNAETDSSEPINDAGESTDLGPVRQLGTANGQTNSVESAEKTDTSRHNS
jgi:hypothetical protein